MKTIKQWKTISLLMGVVLTIVTTCFKVYACNTTASNTSEKPAGPCSSEHNDPDGNPACRYQGGAANFWCIGTSAETECVEDGFYSAPIIVWEYYGSCVNGVCNYNVTVGGGGDDEISWPDGHKLYSDAPCPQG